MKKNNGDLRLPLSLRHFSGYIEGYYGKLLSWEERALLLSSLKRLRLNTYVYAPKEDVFHRAQWKRAYPREWTARFSRFVNDGKKKGVGVVPCLSPGLSYDYCSASDYRELVKKFKAFIACGAETVGLFMDDIPASLPKNCARSYDSLGSAHAVLLSRLQNDLRKIDPTLSLWFCPTVYCDLFADGGVLKNRYLIDLSAGTPRDVAVFWTGPSVVSKSIDSHNIAPVSRLFAGNIIIWDNFYANDYCPHRLFVGSYRGRSSALRSLTRGVCLNPTGLVYTDVNLLGRLSAFVNNSTPAAGSNSSTDEPLPPPKIFAAVARFFDTPFTTAAKPSLLFQRLESFQKALKHLIWEWKSPLQREWYPYLLMLDRDLTLLRRSKKKSVTRDWIDKYYPPVLSSVLAQALTAENRKDS
jgi:hyaluronoglucosaminidase